MSKRNRHPKGEVEAAIQYAEALGWRATMGSGHNWCRLYCPHAARDGCKVGVYSTPKNEGNHARQIRNGIDRCPHRPEEKSEDQNKDKEDQE